MSERERREGLALMPIVAWELQPATQGGIGDEVQLVRRDGFKGRRWAIVQRGYVLNKSGQWEYEPIPSSRTEEWLETVRWSSADEAFQAWEEFVAALAAAEKGE